MDSERSDKQVLVEATARIVAAMVAQENSTSKDSVTKHVTWVYSALKKVSGLDSNN